MSTLPDAGIGAFDIPSFDVGTFDPSRFGLATDLVDADRYARSVDRFRTQGIALPTFAQLADPTRIPEGVQAGLAGVDRTPPTPATCSGSTGTTTCTAGSWTSPSTWCFPPR